MDVKPSWGIFWGLRRIVADIGKVFEEIIPAIQRDTAAMQADIKAIKTNHIEHLESDMKEVKTGVLQIKKHLGIPDEPA